MDWLVLVLSGCMESVWALALGRSDGLTDAVPTVVFAAGLAASMLGLAYATRTLPVGTAYAVWVGIGAALTVAVGMATGDEAASPVKVALIAGLVGCVIGLKLVSDAA
ncbi:MAG: multidrug efflux SMR transporter [Atopobiaceae bacterium]|jgi:quaternary ammonium compound-resistance protein SugE|nr:multidrug efflux SMR transporter [Atopobiaceae bacterium]